MILRSLFFPFGQDIWGLYRKNLIFNLVSRNLKLRYRQSYLGILWTLLIPLMTAGVYFVAFSWIMRVQLPHYLPFLMVGLLPWSFFSQGIIQCMESLVGNTVLINKVPIPPQIFPLAELLSGFIHLVISLPVIFLVALMDGVGPSWTWLFIFPLWLILFAQTYFIGLLMSVAFVYFRDLKHALSIGMQVWFYATPVVYSMEMLPQSLRWLVYLNPVAPIFAGLHSSLLGEFVWRPDLLVSVFAWMLVGSIFSFGLFARLRDHLVESL